MRVAVLLLLGLALGACAAEEGPLVVGILDSPPLGSEVDGKLTGLDVAVAENACKLAGLECETLLIVSVADRIPMLLNGTVDILFAALSVTDARREQVQFVMPFYYAAGAKMYAVQGKEAGFASWDSIKGQKVCTQTGYFANDVITSEYGAVLVESSDSTEQASQLIAGDCVTAVTDSVDLSVIQEAEKQGTTVVATDAPAIDVSPYGAAVRPGEEGLAVKLSGAIAQGMLSAGNNSAIFDLENEYVISVGGQPAPYLADLADAVTYMVPQEE